MEEIEVDIEAEEKNTENVEENKTECGEAKVSPNKDKESPNQKHKFVRLPLARVKSIMKKDTDCGLLRHDAVFLVTKSTEMFIEYLASESGKQLAITGKRKTLMRKDVDTVIHSTPQLSFLDGALD